MSSMGAYEGDFSYCIGLDVSTNATVSCSFNPDTYYILTQCTHIRISGPLCCLLKESIQS